MTYVIVSDWLSGHLDNTSTELKQTGALPSASCAPLITQLSGFINAAGAALSLAVLQDGRREERGGGEFIG